MTELTNVHRVWRDIMGRSQGWIVVAVVLPQCTPLLAQQAANCARLGSMLLQRKNRRAALRAPHAQQGHIHCCPGRRATRRVPSAPRGWPLPQGRPLARRRPLRNARPAQPTLISARPLCSEASAARSSPCTSRSDACCGASDSSRMMVLSLTETPSTSTTTRRPRPPSNWVPYPALERPGNMCTNGRGPCET
jgi:hypothetical protein